MAAETRSPLKFVFVTGRVGVVVRYWEERGEPHKLEVGCRVDVRRIEQLLAPPHRAGAAGFAVLPVAEGGIWRSDILVLAWPSRGEPRYHHHPRFLNGDVGERAFEPAMEPDPVRWTLEQLRDLPGLLRRSGAADLAESVDEHEWRHALPLVEAAIEGCVARLPADLAYPKPYAPGKQTARSRTSSEAGSPTTLR